MLVDVVSTPSVVNVPTIVPPFAQVRRGGGVHDQGLLIAQSVQDGDPAQCKMDGRCRA